MSESGLGVNERAWRIADAMVANAAALRVTARTLPGGARVIDAGIDTPGGYGAGRFLKRGSIVGLGEVERPATFGYACTYRPPHVALLLRYLRSRCRVEVAEGQISGRYERYSGDLAEVGKGELLRWVGA